MPAGTSTSVRNSDPASVTVTVKETTGPGGNDIVVDILVVVDLTFATPAAQTHIPAGYTVSDPPTTVRWPAQTIAAGTEKSFTVKLDPSRTSETVCAPVTTIVTGLYGGVPYFDMQAPVVCFT